MSRVSSRMPRVVSSMILASLAALSIVTSVALTSVALTSGASAQQAPTVRIRGTIEVVDGSVLTIKTREGEDVKVRMTDNVAVFGVVKTSLSEIKEGSYIGVSGMPQPDGTQKALAVHIFPENQRGAAEEDLVARAIVLWLAHACGVVAPSPQNNAQPAILQLINSATSTIDVESARAVEGEAATITQARNSGELPAARQSTRVAPAS